jgi:hypothetical protein
MDGLSRGRDRLTAAGCILLLIAARAWIAFALGIAPEEAWLLDHFQHLPLEELRDGWLTSLLHLHSQPPLWNGLIGLHAKICDAEASCVVRLLHAQNLLCTAGIFMCLYRTLTVLGTSSGVALCSATGFCLLPSVFFYENYAFYPHLTLLMSSILVLGAALWFLRRERIGIMLCALSLTLLGLTWTLFHPVFILIMLGALVASAWRTPARAPALAAALSSMLLVLLPSAKNAAWHGFYGNSSWTGLNLAQTAPTPIPECDFLAYAKRFPAGTPLGRAFNDASVIPLSSTCRERAVAAIAENPTGYAKGRLWSLASSLSKWPSDYLYPPHNWTAFPVRPTPLPIEDRTGGTRLENLLWRMGIFGVNLIGIGFVLLLAVSGPDPRQRRLFLYLSLYLAIFLAATHLFNGTEQHRMRYTVQNLFWIAGTLAIPLLTGWLGAGRRRALRPAPDRA